MRILVIDDETALVKQLQTMLEAERYLVDTAPDGETALNKLNSNSVDLIILDIMLPKLDGLSVLRYIRENDQSTPILMLSARNAIKDKITCLDLGADDYLAKPFSSAELMARVRALLRRYSNSKDHLLTVGDLELDTKSRELRKAGQPLILTSREFAILEFLLYNKNRVISRFSIAEHVWGEAFDPFSMSNFIDVHIKNLRRKIDSPGQPSNIHTLRGLGYIIRDGS
ncbi:MAG: response regulator transcription factor [Deltaproteobacteria bacterium]|nr:response regulator transcription factor [Deltaproteobacteria bacterium]